MDEYLQSLQEQLKGFPPEDQAALMEEIKSHLESGENDPAMGKDKEERRKKLMNELGSPQDMGKGFKALYRPNRFVDYLLIAIPYTLSLSLTALYLSFRPQYPWMDIRLNVLVDFALIAIGLWRRSALLTLFWINLAVMQLLYIVLQGFWQPTWYFGLQTILWAVLLAVLLALFGQIVWKNRHDALIVVYALLPLSMELLGTAVWSIQPVSYIYNPLDRSLLLIFIRMQSGGSYFYGSLLTTALFLLPSNRNIRWIGLVVSALMIGFGRVYLLDYQTGAMAVVAQWVYYLYVLVPATIVFVGWLRDRSMREQLRLAT
jgi:hypothetical protein